MDLQQQKREKKPELKQIFLVNSILFKYVDTARARLRLPHNNDKPVLSPGNLFLQSIHVHSCDSVNNKKKGE